LSHISVLQKVEAASCLPFLEALLDSDQQTFN